MPNRISHARNCNKKYASLGFVLIQYMESKKETISASQIIRNEFKNLKLIKAMRGKTKKNWYSIDSDQKCKIGFNDAELSKYPA